MSQRNGDKSRYHRERKQNIQRRARTREMLQKLAAKTVPGKKPEGTSSTRSASANPA
jgi:hypothetical protein